MANLLKLIVQDYEWIHEGIGLIGNTTFFVGSILFLPRFDAMQTLGLWLFIIGSFLMLIGGAGRVLVGISSDGPGEENK